MRIAICTPIHGDTRAGYTVSLVKMLLFTKQHLPQLEIEYFTHSGSCLPRNRTILTEAALEGKATHILWIDADQTFPPDTMIRLLAWNLPVIGCNIPRRGEPAGPTAVALNGKEFCQSTKAKALTKQIEEVSQMGMGLVLMQMGVLANLKAQADKEGCDVYPIFSVEPDGLSFVSEDTFFFRRLRQAGVKLFVDHALSREVGHIAETVLKFD